MGLFQTIKSLFQGDSRHPRRPAPASIRPQVKAARWDDEDDKDDEYEAAQRRQMRALADSMKPKPID